MNSPIYNEKSEKMMKDGSFDFLKQYQRKDLLRYLSCISFLPDNSSHAYKISMLTYYTLLKRGGKKHLYIPSFRRDVIKHYSFEPQEDPQENLFVDCVHTPKGSFRVFLGIFSCLQYNLTRLLEVAEYMKMPLRKLGIVYALLELSDNIANKLGYKRYEAGINLSDEIEFSDKNSIDEVYQKIKITSNDIRHLCEKYHLHCVDIKHLIYHNNRRKLKCFLENMLGYSIIEKAPFLLYRPGEFLPLYPSAILCAAYRECLNVLRTSLGYDELNSCYIETLITDLVSSISDDKRSLIDRIDYSDNSYLIFLFDADKIAIICVNYLKVKVDFSVVQDNIKSKYPQCSIVKIFLTNSLDLDTYLPSLSAPDLLMPIDDFILMMGQKGMNLQELYYYIEEKKRKNQTGIIQEIDAFAYYIWNKHTLYFEDNYNYIIFSIGNAFEMKANYYRNVDSHVIVLEEHPIMLKHFEDLPVGIPLYMPRAASIKTNKVYVGEIFGNTISFQVDDSNEDEYLLCSEVAKSLILWMYAIARKKFDMRIINGLIVFLTLTDESNLQLRKASSETYFLFIPTTINSITRPEKFILKCFIDGLMQERRENPTVFNDILDVVFDECDGSFLLIQPKGLDFWEINDGHIDCYDVNDNACDNVLEEIANYINMKGHKVKLTIEESASLTEKSIDYLEKEINAILASMSCEDFMLSLFDLHHGMLFWLVTTQHRFARVNALLNYLGENYDEQRLLMNKYSEINNFTMNLIERVSLNNMQGDRNGVVIEKIDRLYALMHILCTLGIYYDILRSNKSEGMRITILENGRIALPRKYFEDIQEYLLELRKLEFYNQDTLIELHKLVPPPITDINTPTFLKAFFAEFKIELGEYQSVLLQSVEYSLNNECPIIDLTEKDFDELILDKAVKNEHKNAFKKKFFLTAIDNNIVKASELFLQRFNREYQLSSRPWVLYNGRVFYSIKSLHHHEKILMDRIFSGRIKSKSKEMTAYKGSINANKGKVFNNAIYSLFIKLYDSTLHVDKEVTIRPDGRLKSEKNLGDIDVLVISKKLRRIICVEAKKYADSRTVYEMITEKDQTIDDMENVEKRDDWLKSHLACFKTICCEVDDTYVIETVVVTFNLSSYVYLADRENLHFRFIPAYKLIENPMVIFNHY